MKSLFFCLFFLLLSFTGAAQVDISLRTNTGEQVDAQELMDNGKAKVLVFWSRYCRYCKLEMKGIRNIAQDWYDDYDAEVVFVSLATYPSDAYESLDFLQEFKKEGIYWLHDNKMKLYRHFEGQSIPFTVLLDKEGNVHQKWNNYDDGLERSIGMYFKKLHAVGSEK